jgi:hypothetical protein
MYQFPEVAKDFLFSKTSRLALGPTQLVPGILFAA